MLFYILSLSRLGSINRDLACYSISWQYLPRRICQCVAYLSRLDSIRQGLACYSISYHALAVSAEAWHAILYLITPWWYPPRLAIPYLFTPWQHPPRLGMLFYILSCLWQYQPRLGILFYISEAQVEQTETCRRA